MDAEDAAASRLPAFTTEPQIVPEDKRAMVSNRGECRRRSAVRRA